MNAVTAAAVAMSHFLRHIGSLPKCRAIFFIHGQKRLWVIVNGRLYKAQRKTERITFSCSVVVFFFLFYFFSRSHCDVGRSIRAKEVENEVFLHNICTDYDIVSSTHTETYGIDIEMLAALFGWYSRCRHRLTTLPSRHSL